MWSAGFRELIGTARSKVDATSGFFPIAVASGLRSLGAAVFLGFCWRRVILGRIRGNGRLWR